MNNFRLHFEQLKASGDLPSPSGVALSLLKLTRKPDVSLSEIAHAVQADPSLSGKLVKFANLLKAGSRSIASVSAALNLLGMNSARQLAISFSILASNRRNRCKNFDYAKFWSASLARAIIAQKLCEREKVAQPEECFVGALLADIGSLALASLYPEAYSEILSHELSPEALLESEKSAFETDHVELTAAMLEDWMLPPLFVSAACGSPQKGDFAEGSRGQQLADIWHFSDLLSRNFVSGEKSIVRNMPEFKEMAAEHELDPEDLAVFSNEAIESWRKWCEIFEVPSLKLPDFEDMMAALPDEQAGTEEHAFKLKVLVAGEDMTGLGTMRSEIMALGHKVDIATNPQDVLQCMLELNPQVILCVFEHDTGDLAASIRKLPAGKFVYLIVVADSEEGLVSAFSSGADAVMKKPFSERELAARMLAAQRFVQVGEELIEQSETLKNTAAELAITSRRAQRASLTDPLTGLPNRRYAIERLAQEWQNSPVISCLMVDIDRFKSVNDRHGHATGDEVIAHAAHVLQAASRSQDAVCRFGGEEFLVILPEASLSAAKSCAERIRKAVEASPFVKDNIRLELTVSIGVASRRPSIRRFEDMIKAADGALYEAKQKGRNIVQSL